MHNFGFKIVDKNAQALDPILEYAVAHGRPVEVGLYFAEPDALGLFEQRLGGVGLPVNAHTNHQLCNVFNLHHTQRVLAEHIRTARRFGAGYSVLHTANLPMTLNPARRPALMNLLLDNLARAEELGEQHDYRLFLENVYHPLSFYRDLFAGIQARGFRRIHFCFDIGHAKVWSGDTLDDWLEFMDELAEARIDLHCHLHANQGFTDEHLSLGEAVDLGIEGPDGYYNPYGYPGAFWVLERRFPRSVKVFEVKPEHALGNLRAVEQARP